MEQLSLEITDKGQEFCTISGRYMRQFHMKLCRAILSFFLFYSTILYVFMIQWKQQNLNGIMYLR